MEVGYFDVKREEARRLVKLKKEKSQINYDNKNKFIISINHCIYIYMIYVK